MCISVDAILRRHRPKGQRIALVALPLALACGGSQADETVDPDPIDECVSSLDPIDTAPVTLSQTGLYSDVAARALAPYAREFTPQFALWSDGAEKTRWAYIPECDATIDNSDEDSWSFPVGTRMWKQFSSPNGVLLETRMIHRFGPGPEDLVFAAYQWNEDEADAVLVPDGAENTRGTAHDIPDEDQCMTCHGPNDFAGGLPSRYLGFSAIQLSHDGPGETMATLSAEGVLSQPNDAGYAIPGNEVERAALGYLHANCSHCHNDTDDAINPPGSDLEVFMDMRLKVADAIVDATAVYNHVVEKPAVEDDTADECASRVASGDLSQSCLRLRMATRDSELGFDAIQMPPLGSETVDPDGLAVIEAWILAL